MFRFFLEIPLRPGLALVAVPFLKLPMAVSCQQRLSSIQKDCHAQMLKTPSSHDIFLTVD